MDYLSLACEECSDTLPPYTDPGCDLLKSKLVTAYLFACGVGFDDICPQVESDIADLVTAGRAQKLSVIGDFPESTPNTVDNPWTCGPDTLVDDYTQGITLRTPYYMDPETGASNYEFFNQLREEGSIGGLIYATESGVAFKPRPKGSLAVTDVSFVDEGGILAVQITVSYKTNSLDRTYFAHSALFGC